MALEIWKDTFTVNALTDDYQYEADIIGLSNGNILIVWHDNNDIAAGGAGFDIMGQIYDPTGKPVGGQIFLNDGYGNNRAEYRPEVAATADGGFILTYNYHSNNNNKFDQLFRRFDADGSPTGQQNYVVNDVSGGTVYSDFEIVHRPDGTSIVTYRRDTGTDQDLIYRTIGTDGTVGAEVEVRYDQDPSGSAQGDPDNPTAAVLTDGRVIVAFQEEDNDIYGAEYSIINTDGSVSMRGNVAVLTTRADDVDVAALSDGGFVITWREGTTLKAQIYDNTSPFPVEEGGVLTLANDTNDKDTARVTTLDDGGFAVAWIDRADKVIMVRTFDENGVTRETQEVDYGGFDAYTLDVGLSADGRILTTWQVYPDYTYSDIDVNSAILDPREGLITVTDGTPTTASRSGSEIDGGDGTDVFYGMEGKDDFSSKKGSDFLYGGLGNDELTGGKGADKIWGGKGNDLVEGGIGADEMWGGKGQDEIWGFDGRDMATGGGGGDTLYGGGKDDELFGGSGADKLFGGDGDDSLFGGSGRDELTGGTGADEMTGGAGEDVFIFNKASHSKPGSGNRDVIFDFEAGEDIIDLRDIDADTTRSGDQQFEFIGTDQFDDEGQLRVRVADGSTFVQADQNGDGKADFQIELIGEMTLEADDFIL